MSVEFYRESPGKFDSRTLNRKTLDRWTGRRQTYKTKQKRNETNNNKEKLSGPGPQTRL